MVRAFSLVELSIVLVILGLLTGGILSGQSLIRAAELRSASTEYQNYTTALYSFRDKYFALPGDFKDATKFWGKDNAACSTDTGTAATPGACNGNGDGEVTMSASANARGEQFQLWKHLALAGLIEGTYSGISGSAGALNAVPGVNVPASKLANAAWAFRYLGTLTGDAAAYDMSYNHVFILGGPSTGNNSPVLAAFRPEEAWNIDTKIDDGRPAHGVIIARYWNNACATANTGATTSANRDAVYNLSNSTIQCSFKFLQNR